jgi:hypothetical protein
MTGPGSVDAGTLVLFDQAEESLRRSSAGVLHDMSIVRERRPWEPGGAGW